MPLHKCETLVIQNVVEAITYIQLVLADSHATCDREYAYDPIEYRVLHRTSAASMLCGVCRAG